MDGYRFLNDLGAGSAQMRELIAYEEKEHGIKFADDAVEKLKTGK